MLYRPLEKKSPNVIKDYYILHQIQTSIQNDALVDSRNYDNWNPRSSTLYHNLHNIFKAHQLTTRDDNKKMQILEVNVTSLALISVK